MLKGELYIMAKYKLSDKELLEHWEDQIEFIRSSIENFDNGNDNESRRIATSLRILFHQTDQSKSLLKQLKFPIIFYSSGGLYTPSNLLSSWTLLSMEMGSKGLYYRPSDDDSSHSTRTFFLRFEDWWNEIIFDDKNNFFTRKDIVLFVANQDGGAHVDPSMKESFAKLVKYNSLGWVDGMGNYPQNNPIYQAIRVIANEVLTSNNLFKTGMKNRFEQKEKDFEMRFVDSNKRYKWSNTEINKSEETQQIVEKHKVEPRKIYIQEFSNGEKKEYVGL